MARCRGAAEPDELPGRGPLPHVPVGDPPGTGPANASVARQERSRGEGRVHPPSSRSSPARYACSCPPLSTYRPWTTRRSHPAHPGALPVGCAREPTSSRSASGSSRRGDRAGPPGRRSAGRRRSRPPGAGPARAAPGRPRRASRGCRARPDRRARTEVALVVAVLQLAHPRGGAAVAADDGTEALDRPRARRVERPGQRGEGGGRAGRYGNPHPATVAQPSGHRIREPATDQAPGLASSCCDARERPLGSVPAAAFQVHRSQRGAGGQAPSCTW